MTQGPADRVPCPHCKVPQDFSDEVVDTGVTYNCEGCNRQYEIVGVSQVTVVYLKPIS